jgi:guanylate kinase
LLCAEDDRFVLSRSWTTRAPRSGEGPNAYTFVDRATFEQNIANGGFVEWAEYHGNLYGTPVPDPKDPRHLVLVIETKGARNIVDRFPDASVIVIVPPSVEELEARLRRRGDDEEHVVRRLQAAKDELEAGLALTDQFVVNDDLTQAVAEVRRILANRLSGEKQNHDG